MTILRNDTDRARWIAFLQQQPLPLNVDCNPWKPSRSNEQNALLFGVIYPPIAQAMGYPVDGDNGIHAFMCGTHFGWVDRPVPKTPRNPEGVASFPFRSTTRNEHGKRSVLSKAEFSDFIATVERIAAQAGVFIPMKETA
jgi:hypothetical protein